MASISIFKIEKDKIENFKSFLINKIGEPKECNALNDSEFVFQLYWDKPSLPNSLSWAWALNEFGEQAPYINRNPKGVITIEYNNEIYAVTFGQAFFLVDSFSDKNFAFNFARKHTYKLIKSTAQTNPNATKIKTINSYIDSNYFEYGSGESFIKLKAKINLPEDFNVFKEFIEIGTSIKFSVDLCNIAKCKELILYIEESLKKEDVSKIPFFNKVCDKEEKNNLDSKLQNAIRDNTYNLSFSDFDIIGTTEVFYAENTSFKVFYGRMSKKLNTINIEELKNFCVEKSIDFYDKALELNIKVEDANGFTDTVCVRDLIDFVDDETNSILSKGVWYRYNNDYINYLNNSISQIPVEYNIDDNFSKSAYESFLELKFNEEKSQKIYFGKTEEQIKKSIKNQYYKEKYYNAYLGTKGYQVEDRNLSITNGHKIEICDLWKDETIFAVKIGHDSNKLSYTIDQIINTIRLVRENDGTLKYNPFNKVVVWFVLDTANQLQVDDRGNPQISSLNMLILKNKLDSWKKESYNLNYIPSIKINYIVD